MLAGILLSLLAGLGYATGSALERREAKQVDHDKSLRPSLLTTLVVKPLWLLGLAGDGLGLVLQLLALRIAPLILVEPLMVTGTLFGLPIGVLTGERKMTRRDWIGATLVVAGLATFILAAGIREHDFQPAGMRWILLSTICFAAVLFCVALGRSRHPGPKAALYGSGAGISFGLTAAFAKSVFLTLKGHAILSLLTTPTLYGVLVSGLFGFLLIQSAFQAGPLAPALASMTIWEPVLGVVVGVSLFREHIRSQPAFVVAMVAGLAVMFLGIVALASTVEAIER